MKNNIYQNMGRSLFQEVYPFTTEVISGYYKELDFADKEVMTLGSSSDQAFNALLLGAKKIIVYDINENSQKFGKLKRDVIINSNINNVWGNVLCIDIPKKIDFFPAEQLRNMNPYMKDAESFKKLQDLLITRFDDIEYRVGNIMEVDNLDNELFDIIITSNVFQYLEEFISPLENPYDKLKDIFNKLKKHLKDDGVVQFLYHYAINNNLYYDECASRNLIKVLNCIHPDKLDFYEFDNGMKDGIDCAIIYRKKR